MIMVTEALPDRSTMSRFSHAFEFVVVPDINRLQKQLYKHSATKLEWWAIFRTPQLVHKSKGETSELHSGQGNGFPAESLVVYDNIITLFHT